MSVVNAERAARIVEDAGGRIIGRTRLQKTAYLLSVAGLEDGFSFVYKHYGPFSEALADGALAAGLLGLIDETEQRAAWGGSYSTYTSDGGAGSNAPAARIRLATEAASADAIELELAATAVYLATKGHADPWTETARRKPEKGEGGRIERAKALLLRLAAIPTPQPLPQIA